MGSSSIQKDQLGSYNMKSDKTAKCDSAEERLLEDEVRKLAERCRSPLRNHIDSHKWASKMEILRILSS